MSKNFYNFENVIELGDFVKEIKNIIKSVKQNYNKVLRFSHIKHEKDLNQEQIKIKTDITKEIAFLLIIYVKFWENVIHNYRKSAEKYIELLSYASSLFSNETFNIVSLSIDSIQELKNHFTRLFDIKEKQKIIFPYKLYTQSDFNKEFHGPECSGYRETIDQYLSKDKTPFVILVRLDIFIKIEWMADLWMIVRPMEKVKELEKYGQLKQRWNKILYKKLLQKKMFELISNGYLQKFGFTYKINSKNQKCIICNKINNLKKCSECLHVNYCSKRHQIQHWHIHKKYCQKIKKTTNL